MPAYLSFLLLSWHLARVARVFHSDKVHHARSAPSLERFFRGNPEILAGERAIKAYENTDSGLGGYIEVARREGAEGKRCWRRKPESNRRTRICNPLHDHSAIAP